MSVANRRNFATRGGAVLSAASAKRGPQSGSLLDGLYDFTVISSMVTGSIGALDGNADSIAGDGQVIVGSAANKGHRLTRREW